jgi:hypothetical protein
MAKLTGGRTLYGHALGVIMLDTVFPRVPGDVGNALTWPFPVRYRIVPGARISRVIGPEPDSSLLEPLFDAARQLEADGVRAITTSCGLLAVFQRELAAAVSVPVLTSALLQVPLVAQLIRPDQRVGVLTARADQLTPRHFAFAGWSADEVRVRIGELAPDAVLHTVFTDDATEADTDVLEAELVAAATDLVHEHPDVAALVLECTNFVPFSQAIRAATGIPVFDLYTLVMQVYNATAGRDFPIPQRGEWCVGIVDTVRR